MVKLPELHIFFKKFKVSLVKICGGNFLYIYLSSKFKIYNMKGLILVLGIVVGLFLSIFIHDVAPNCSKNRELKSTRKIKPVLVITRTEEKSDTLYIYKRNNNDK